MVSLERHGWPPRVDFSTTITRAFESSFLSLYMTWSGASALNAQKVHSSESGLGASHTTCVRVQFQLYCPGPHAFCSVQPFTEHLKCLSYRTTWPGPRRLQQLQQQQPAPQYTAKARHHSNKMINRAAALAAVPKGSWRRRGCHQHLPRPRPHRLLPPRCFSSCTTATWSSSAAGALVKERFRE